ncbi:transposase [soil metagenome]
MRRTGKYPEEIRREAVRLVRTHRDEYDSEWAAISSVAAKFGAVPQTVHSWVRRADVDDGVVDGVSSDERQKIKDLQRENRELRRANEILKAASVFFAAELDPRPKS